MITTIAYLGPEGTYSQLAALAYSIELEKGVGIVASLKSFPSIARSLQATAQGDTTLTLVPVENSIEGGVTPTLDTLWQLKQLRIHQAMVMPIDHSLLSYAPDLEAIKLVYSHPQALSQCQLWLEQKLPWATLVPTNSTAEPLQQLSDSPTIAAVSSTWAAELYGLPVLAEKINDHRDNCTKFWILSRDGSQPTPYPASLGSHTSLAFSLPVNAPGALLKPLQVFAEHGINLSRIESRPAKRALGEYVFFVDLEASMEETRAQTAVQALASCTESLINFGSYGIISLDQNLAIARTRYAQLQPNPLL
ncbi:MAG: prephenate dehydratase [Cyanobacteria bacterium REEB459]|nr:prephenate dehydratase [Cyanobacteria bacterium REEB459]